MSKISVIVEEITDIDEAHIFYGSVIDEKMGDDLHVTVIATGLTLDENAGEEPEVVEQPVPSVNSTQPVDPSLHTSALNSQKQSQYQENPIRSNAAPEQTKTKTNSIQDYLKRQQNK